MWLLKYCLEGKEKRISLGVDPDVDLKLAGERRGEARRQLADGIDPDEHSKAHKSARDDAVACEWHSKMKPTWSHDHADKIIRRFEHDMLPRIGSKPVADLNAPEVLTTIQQD